MSESTPNIDQIRAAAEAGDAKSQFKLAICYLKGAGVPRDFAQGVVWMRKAAEGGLADAQYPMGLFTAEGKGVKQDKAASIEWFAKAAEQGHKDAQRSLAKIALAAYRETGSETSKAGALKWFKAAANQGDVESKAELEKLLAADTNENGNDGADEATPDELRRRAESGDADACYRLGNMYYAGDGVEENGPEAFRWHMKGAELGNAGSACSVASCYMGGDCGVEQDQAEGIRWYKKAAEMGDGEAHYLLGMCYLAGYGVKKNEAEGKKWVQKALDMGYVPDDDDEEEENAEIDELRRKAESGDADACYRLGNYYFSLIGDEEDDAAAVKWHRKGAELGHPGSQLSLGLCNLVGYGLIRENQPEAVRWFQKAADQGYAEAQYYLGACYMGGMGVKKDKKEGEKLLSLALSQGYTPLEGEYCGPEEKWTKWMRHSKTVIVILWIIAVAAFIWWTTYKGK